MKGAIIFVAFSCLGLSYAQEARKPVPVPKKFAAKDAPAPPSLSRMVEEENASLCKGPCPSLPEVEAGQAWRPLYRREDVVAYLLMPYRIEFGDDPGSVKKPDAQLTVLCSTRGPKRFEMRLESERGRFVPLFPPKMWFYADGGSTLENHGKVASQDTVAIDDAISSELIAAQDVKVQFFAEDGALIEAKFKITSKGFETLRSDCRLDKPPAA